MAKIVLITVYDNVAVGLRIMANILKSNGHSVSLIFLKNHQFEPILNSENKNMNYECVSNGILKGTNYDVIPWTDYEVSLLTNLLKDLKPDIIGFGARSPLDDVNIELLTEVRNTVPDSIIVAGGFGPSLRPDKYLIAAHYVVFGEGEEALLNIAR
ncbi:MAG: cobalamin B12-binding domain-containing protein, partial [Desulfobacula sp.]|nr:cobalamin B12-binding domain-containing protein [Desulfobacula sp.]